MRAYVDIIYSVLVSALADEAAELRSSAARRRAPSPTAANYIPLRVLAAQLRAEIVTQFGSRKGLSIVDVGCGQRPYEETFRPMVAEYVGVDYREGPLVDVVAPAERLPFEPERFDCVLSSQVLEHVQDPGAAVREAWRVLHSGGVALFSTHGVANYHANPDDYWRWTHAGLERLFRQSGSWRSIDVRPNGGWASAILYLVGMEAEVLARKAGVLPFLRLPMFVANLLAWRLDRAYLRRRPDRPPDLAPNYLVVAVKN